MKFQNSFVNGVMNKDVDLRLIPKNTLIDAKNARIITNESNNNRSAQPLLGTTTLTSLALGENAKAIGVVSDGFSNTIYWAVVSDSGSFVCSLDIDTNTETIVISDTRPPENNVLNFQFNSYMDMSVLNDSDNGKTFLFLTDGINEPLSFEVGTALSLTDSAFNFIDVSIIKSPPVSAPIIVLEQTLTGSENNLETKFLSFSYRYKYIHDQLSALSPFSEFAFFPKSFSYDFATGTNNSMFNNFSKVDISFDVGGDNVIGLEIIVKESRSNTAFIVESFNKENEGWADNTIQTIEFSNNKILRALDNNQLLRLFDSVPLSANTLTTIGNLLVLGGYKENYNLEFEGNIITPEFNLAYTSQSRGIGIAHKTVKTNRDYEIGVSYCDGKGRQTPPFTSQGNTVFVDNLDSNKENKLQLTISSKAPDWASFYRLHIKQSKIDYDVITSLSFVNDGIHVWVKLEGNDIDKINEGDFIVVKSDTSGLKNTAIRTKVLEIKNQGNNFLGGGEEEGNYMKLAPDGFTISDEGLSVFQVNNRFTRNTFEGRPNNFANSVSYIESKFYTGINLDDLTVSGTYASGNDTRYEIQIDSVGATDTFRFREFNVSDNIIGAFSASISITGAAQPLSNGVEVTFASITGHTLNDVWFVSAKSGSRLSEFNGVINPPPGAISGRAIIALPGKTNSDEVIPAGATISIRYDDGPSTFVDNEIGFAEADFTSSKEYPNIEEWFFGDNIDLSVLYSSLDLTEIVFRRGSLFTGSENGKRLSVNPSGDMHLCFSSSASDKITSKIKVDTRITISQFDNNLIFETIPTEENSEIFFELPTSYNISNGNHLGGSGDTDQVFGVTDAVINVDYFNAFGWYNGFESIKIGDTFNQKSMVLDSRPSVPLENYREVSRIASLTHSGVYESTTQFNALNEFNTAINNFKDMDTSYGLIRKIHSDDTDLEVFQEDKTHKVLFNKSVLFNADGTGNVSQNNFVLGQEIARSGDYGISSNPESFSFFGKRKYHLDKDRGVLLRLSVDGYTEISQLGMHDFFRTLPNQLEFVGGYDPFNDEYLINISDTETLSFSEKAGGFTSFFSFKPERMIGLNNRLYSLKEGQVNLHDDNIIRNSFYGQTNDLKLRTVFNDLPHDNKFFKSLNLESNSPNWTVNFSTDYSKGVINAEEFVLQENEFYSFLRQNEDVSNLNKATKAINVFNGVGEVSSFSTNTLTFLFSLPKSVSVGDSLFVHDPILDELNLIGVITSFERNTTSTITVDAVSTTPLVGDFIVNGKDPRIEGESIRGHFLDVTLTNNSTEDYNIFSIKTEASKSFD